MSNNKECVGDWEKEKVLGTGGFGIVTLWKNKNDESMVALKMCREGVDSCVSQKYKERWANEVDIMQKLNHPNVVRAIKLPKDLAEMTSPLPILCMEYCSKGDLRKVLNLAENCSGLSETEIRAILKDIKAAIEYLHSHKIIHRDLKPENIVLQPLPEKGTLYKLIDLGYAKELDQSSLCSSFVGTLQYIAPELFTQVYTSSVDFWSLGLVCHEIITGVRPFLPNLTPVAWMNLVKRKTQDDICVYQNADETVVYSQELFAENHISQCLKYEFEKWLRLALEWDGNKRGRGPDNKIVIFSSLTAILNKKIIVVFSTITFEKLSYEVDESTLVETVKLWIERDTKQSVEDQIILLPGGEEVDSDSLAYECWDSSNQVSMAYVLSRNGLKLPDVVPKLPFLVTQLLESPKDLHPYFHLKRVASNAVFFVQSQLSLYQTFLEAYAVKMLSLMTLNKTVHILEKEVSVELQQVIAKQRLNNDSLQYDMRCYNKINHNDSEASDYIETWKSKYHSCDLKSKDLCKLAQKLNLRVAATTRKFEKIQSYSNPGAVHIEQLSTLCDLSYRVYDTLRRKPKEERETKKCNSIDMVKIVYNCLKVRDKMLRDEEFSKHLEEVSQIEAELSLLITPLKGLKQHVTKCNSDVTSCHLRRQKDIWQLVFNLKSKTHSLTHESNPYSSLPTPLRCPSTTSVASIGTPGKPRPLTPYETNSLRDEDQQRLGASGRPQGFVAECIQRGLSTSNLIQENHYYRSAFEARVTQIFQQYNNIIAESEKLDQELMDLLKRRSKK